MLTFGSWCSGIEAASEAWLPLRWTCAYVAEIEPFPCAYLAQRHGAGRPRYMPRPEDVEFPAGYDADDRDLFKTLVGRDATAGDNALSPADIAFVQAWKARTDRRAAIAQLDRIEFGDRLPNLGDISQVSAAELPPVDILGAGFPCQDFSIAGLRASLSGRRGSLSTVGVRLILEAAELGLVRGAVLEQVPDVLNTADNAWGNILGALVGADAALEGLDHGGKWPRAGMVAGPRARVAWRILDAQHFGLAQRRERVWAVVDFGDGPDPAAVLFERKGVPGDHPARGEAGEDVAGTLAGGARQRGGFSYDDIPAVPEVAGTITSRSGNSSRPAGAHGTLVPDWPQRRAAFGGNNTSGPINVATARTASHTASGRQDFESETFVVDSDYAGYRHSDIASTLRAPGADAGHGSEGEGFDASEDGSGRGTPLVPIAFTCKDFGGDAGELSPTLRAMGHSGSHANSGGQVAIAFNARQDPCPGEIVQPLDTDAYTQAVAIRTNQTGANGYGMAENLAHTLDQATPQAVAFSLRGREGGAMPEVEEGDVAPALRAAEGGSTRPFVAQTLAFQQSQSGVREVQLAPTLDANMGSRRMNGLVGPTMAVRRITVVEGELLQGFRPNATLIRWPSAARKGEDLAETIAYLRAHGYGEAEAAELAQTPDGPRYKAIGNSWPVPVPRWIGRRIAALLRPGEEP